MYTKILNLDNGLFSQPWGGAANFWSLYLYCLYKMMHLTEGPWLSDSGLDLIIGELAMEFFFFLLFLSLLPPSLQVAQADLQLTMQGEVWS